MGKTDRIQIAIGVAGLVLSGLYLFEKHGAASSSTPATAPLPEAGPVASGSPGVAGGAGGGGGAGGPGGPGGSNLVAPATLTGQQTTSASAPSRSLNPKFPGEGFTLEPGHVIPMARVQSSQPIR